MMVVEKMRINKTSRYMIYNLAAGVLFHSVLMLEDTPSDVPMAVRIALNNSN